jgi:enamine deaminase RidA (YjgF/YER057c/UK114 family)
VTIDLMSVDMAVIVAEAVPVIIERFAGRAPWEERYGYCRVVRAGRWALTAGTTATGRDGVLHPGDAYAQARAAFMIALEALEAAGVSRAAVVRTRMYVIDITDADAVGQAHAEIFGAVRPVATMVQVGALADPLHLIEVEVEAYLEDFSA